MPLFLEARAVVALGWDCKLIGAYTDTNPRGVTHGELDDRTLSYIEALADQAEEARLRLQFFVPGMALEQPGDLWRRLQERGHAIDQHTYSPVRLDCGDLDLVRNEIARTNALFLERLGTHPLGLRAQGMYPAGLEDMLGVQQVILEEGLTFVSSLYATKSPTSRYDVFADKNAYMIMKHHQPRRYASGLLEIPAAGYSDRHFLDDLQRPLQDWIQHLQNCLDFAYDMGGLLYAPVLHPDTHSRYDPGREALAALVAHAARKHDPVRFCTMREVAAAFAEGETGQG